MRRPIAAQVGHDDAKPLARELRRHGVVAARGVGEPVQQDDGLAGGGTVLLVGDVETRRPNVLDESCVPHPAA